MSSLVDRRLSGKNRSAVNRQRFLRRFKGQIRKAVSKAIAGRKVADLERGESVSIPSKDMKEPFFHHGPGAGAASSTPATGSSSAVTVSIVHPAVRVEVAARPRPMAKAWTSSLSSCREKSSWTTSSRTWHCRIW